MLNNQVRTDKACPTFLNSRKFSTCSPGATTAVMSSDICHSVAICHLWRAIPGKHSNRSHFQKQSKTYQNVTCHRIFCRNEQKRIARVDIANMACNFASCCFGIVELSSYVYCLKSGEPTTCEFRNPMCLLLITRQ